MPILREDDLHQSGFQTATGDPIDSPTKKGLRRAPKGVWVGEIRKMPPRVKA